MRSVPWPLKPGDERSESPGPFRPLRAFPSPPRAACPDPSGFVPRSPFRIPRWKDFEPWTLDFEPPLFRGIMIRALTVKDILDEQIAKKLA